MSNTSHDLTFRPRARLLEVLGDQLIRHHRIAVFELVKNSYDADAPDVTVRLENVQRPEIGRIEITDHGEGMDLSTIRDQWLEPASDHKARQRAEDRRTPKFRRLPLGEKGVGRFAVQKLGRKLKLVTKRPGHPEYSLDLDWRLFESQQYLSDTHFQIIERDPELFTGDSHGTCIEISDLNQTWTRGDVRRLYRAVNSMVSPFDSDDPFTVHFHIHPHAEWLQNLFSTDDASDAALFDFSFFLDDDGLEWSYEFRPYPALMRDYPNHIAPRSTSCTNDKHFEFFNLRPPDEETGSRWSKRVKRNHPVSLERLGIGPIMGRILVFDLDANIKKYLNDYQGLSSFLKEQGGVRVYRDGVRVYDYGEPGNDWLGLDVRRVQTPAGRLSNNLILGEVHLDLAKSSALVEKTNREGFIENEAFEEFRYAILCILLTLEHERMQDKKRMRDAFKDEGGKPNSDSPEQAIAELRHAIDRKGLTKSLGPHVDRVYQTYTAVRDNLMSAVGSGLGLSLIFHEVERGVKSLTYALDHGAPKDQIQDMSKSLTELLEGASVLVRSTDKQSIAASKIVQHALFANSGRSEYHRIQLHNAFTNLNDLDFRIKGSRRMLVAAVSNLIDNAIHWIKVSTADYEGDRYIWIGPSSAFEGPALVIADSGAGFRDPGEFLVQPFYTRRSDGMGLGLYYADMAMKAHGGRILFPQPEEVEVPDVCTGGIVALVFSGANQ